MLSDRVSASMRKTVNAIVLITVLLCFPSIGIAGTGTLNDYNPYNINIPDNGSSVNSDLALSSAPSGATITKVKIYYEIRHTYIGDLKVWLTTYYNGAWHDYILKNREGGSADNIIETRDNLTTWNGASPNQTWYLVAQDMATGDTGYIDFFELWVTYSVNDPPNTPSSEDPSDGATGVSITKDLDWSSSDPNGDTIYYTVYFEKNDSTPDVAIKSDATGSAADPGTLDYSSHYYWQVKADDHKGGVIWSPVWDFYTEPTPVIDADITGVSFDLSQVKRGIQAITATVTLRNTGNQTWTFYVGGSSIKSGDTTWYDWSPSRASKSLSPNESGTVQLTWSTPAGAPLGMYGFFSKAFKYSTGDEFVDDDWRESAFEVVDPVNSGLITGVSFNKTSVRRGLDTITATVTIQNTGDQSYTFYLGGSSIKADDATWYDWTPSRASKTINAGQSDTVNVSWSCPSDAPVGTYGFYSKLFKASTGTAYFDEDWRDTAFQVVEPATGALITGVTFDRTTSARGIDVVNASVTVQNTGDIQATFYVGASCILSGGATWYDWSPARTKLVLNAGASASVPITWLPPSQSEAGSYGFYSKVFKAFSGTDFYDEDWRDKAFQVSVPASFSSVNAHEIIVRAGSSLDLGNSTDVQALIDQCLANGVPAISLMIKHDETGELLYPSSLPYTGRYNSYPASYIADLINLAHENGIKIYAWIPMFNDKVLYNARSDYGMYFRDDVSPTVWPRQDWVSPANSGVTAHRLSMVQEVFSQFAFDGIRIDHSRYNSDWEDMSSAARTAFSSQFGVDPVNLTGPGGAYWIDWIDWRADRISIFNESVRNQVLASVPTASVGSYIFTDSASAGGYRDRTWSGQRYEDYGVLGRNLGINTMPMVYWQDWSEGDVVGYIDSALRYGRQLGAPTELIPVFSVTERTEWGGVLTENQILQYMNLCGKLCQSNGVRRISYFYYGTWQANHFARIRASYQGPVGAVTPGRHDFGSVPIGQAAQRTFTVENVGTESLTVTPSCDSPFSVVSPMGSIVLASGQSEQVTIEYSPIAQGVIERKLRFQTVDGTIERSVLGTGTPQNNPPTDIALSGESVQENQPIGISVGTLSTTDPNAGNTFTYTLVSGAGSTGNAFFTISGNTLQTATSFNYEVKSSYSVRVRTTDQGGLWFEKVFIILVEDVTETLKGDLNSDGNVNLEDAIMALRVLVGLQPQDTINLLADVNGDGKIGIPEVLYILRKTAGISD